MRSSYAFAADLLPDNLLADTDTLDRPVPEYTALTERNIVAVMAEAASAGAQRMIIRMSPDLFALFMSEEDPVWKWLDLAGIKDAYVSYSESDMHMELSSIELQSGNVFAAEAAWEEDLIDALKQARTGTYSEVHLYLSESLYSRFRRDSDFVWDWLKRGGFRDADVQYSDQSRKIVYRNLVR